MRVNSPTCEPPRPCRPATPMRMTSLAPSTRPDDFVPAMVIVAAAARVDFKNLRRVRRVMARSFPGDGGEGRTAGGRQIVLLYPSCKGRASTAADLSVRARAAKGGELPPPGGYRSEQFLGTLAKLCTLLLL